MFRIFDKLGGVDATLDALQKRLPATRKRLSSLTIKGWKSRRKIPGVVADLLMQECAERGIPCEITDFRSDAPKPEHREAAE